MTLGHKHMSKRVAGLKAMLLTHGDGWISPSVERIETICFI